MASLTPSQKTAIRNRMNALRESLKKKHSAALKSALAKRDAMWRERVNGAKRRGDEQREALAAKHREAKERKRVAFWERKLANGNEWAAAYLPDVIW